MPRKYWYSYSNLRGTGKRPPADPLYEVSPSPEALRAEIEYEDQYEYDRSSATTAAAKWPRLAGGVP